MSNTEAIRLGYLDVRGWCGRGGVTTTKSWYPHAHLIDMRIQKLRPNNYNIKMATTLNITYMCCRYKADHAIVTPIVIACC